MQHLKDKGQFLPPASLRLLVPPLRLVSAALWQVVQRRDVMDYGLVEEFVVTVLDVVPDLMSYREKVQLIMGLRAQICDPEVEASESNFLKLIKTLLEDPVERDRFFQNVFPEEFGSKYHSALQTLVWEFLSRLEKLLPAPTLQQTASWFLPDPSVLEECGQSVRHPQPLRTLLQYHTNLSPDPHVEANDNNILSPSPRESSTDQSDPENQSEPIQTFMTIQSPASYCCESEMTPSLDYRESQRGMNLDRTANVDILPSNEEVECVNKETLDKESEMDQAFLHLRADSGPKIQPGAHRFKKEVQDVSNLSTSCRLRQPTVLLHRLDITDTLSPVSEVFPTPSRERLQIDNVETQGRREDRVVSQKRERNVEVEPSDSQPRYSLVPGPCRTKGQPKRSKRVKICSLCGKTFREAKDLTAHITSHTEQRPYQYILCRQDVEHHEDLQKHRQNVCEAAAQPEEDNTSATSTRDCTEISQPRPGAHRLEKEVQDISNLCRTSTEDCTEISQPSDTLTQRRHMTTQHGKPRQSSKVTKCAVCDETFSKASHLGYTPGKLLNCGDVSENSTLKKHKKVCLKTKKHLSCSLCGDTFDPLSQTSVRT
uniref:C2H2-type domain-containing protein n=1 Tax=Oncorhynchus tshawytscha TaxID=74940 RepID=A0AAZ3QHL4_ONCTS